MPTLKELKKEASIKKIKGRSKMNKAQLINALGKMKKSRKPKRHTSRKRRLSRNMNTKNKRLSIEFNSKRSKPHGFNKLSNFYGGVEFEYMIRRFKQNKIIHLFEHLKVCDNQEFWRWLQILNPKGTKKKPVTQKQMDYWFTEGGIHNGKPIRGIAAQLLGTMVRMGPTSLKRRKAVMKELKLSKIEINSELSNKDKRSLMKRCLEYKYENSYFRNLLLSTGDAVLHEIPLRGKGEKNNWTHKVVGRQVYGKDWLGQLLMDIRSEIRNKLNIN